MIMATVSTRLDDDIKTQAENIADQIGIPLSAAINVFINQFIHCRGFPFAVKLPETTTYKGYNSNKSFINLDFLDTAVKKAVVDVDSTDQSVKSAYYDKETNSFYTSKD